MKKHFIILLFILIGIQLVFAASEWTQTNWQGGSGQQNLSDVTKFWIEDSCIEYYAYSGELRLNIAAPGRWYDKDYFDSTGTYKRSDDWSARNSGDPVPSNTTAFQGSWSLYMASGWGRNFETGTGLETGQAYTCSTHIYPFMAMAYKIPAATKSNMLIQTNQQSWRSVMITCPSGSSYPARATWNYPVGQHIIADDQWHYTIIKLDSMLQANGLGTKPSYNSVIWF